MNDDIIHIRQVPTKPDNDWSFCEGRAVVIRVRCDDKLPRQLIRDGADYVVWIGLNGELNEARVK